MLNPSELQGWWQYVTSGIVVLGKGKGRKGKGQAIPVTGCGGPQGCETSRLPHFLDCRLTDGGEVFSLTCRLLFTPRKITGTHFC
jgi:hypothetical protein